MRETEKIKVLAIIPGEEEGPVMIFAKRQAASVERAGVPQFVYYLKSRLSPLKLYKSYREVKELIRRFKPDLIHVHYGTVTSFFSLFFGLPVIISFQGSDINRTPGDGLLRDFFGRLLSNISAVFVRKIICVSQGLIHSVWWAQKKCVLIPSGINTDLFKPEDKKTCRQTLGWKEDEFIILFNGRDPVVKRQDIAESAVKLASSKTQKPIRLEVLSGMIDAGTIPTLINASSCILMCSDNEGSPMVVKEALSCNIPVVTTVVGDAADRVKGVEGCFIVDQDAAVIANVLTAMAEAGTDPRTNGRPKLIADGLSEESVCEKLIGIYREVVGLN
ncbi:MAG TPA: glycosyltransferase family 4 protein [Bacteroidia bacterium]|nr:glycosyltransferase family 4 protein [Bacteroidia bacterium]